MSKNIRVDDEVMTEEQFEEKLNRSYKVGVSVGWKEAGNKIMGYAVQQFTNGHKDADGTRRLADELIRMGDSKHPGVK